MTEEQQRIAIAKHFGWHSLCPVDGGALFGYPKGTPNNGRTRDVCPNWLTDLNACAEFEATLTDEDEITDYCEHLNDACGSDVGHGKPSFMPYFAKAPQRCAAFLKVKGLWKEDA